MKKSNKKLKGIGGWLLLFTITLFIGIVLSLYLWYGIIFSIIFNGVTFQRIFYIILIAIHLPLSIYVLYLEFRKKKMFVKWMIILIWVGVLISIIFDISEGEYLNIPTRPFIGLLWTVYFYTSLRVKNTFVK